MKSSTNNIYLSDLLSVPMPKHAASHQDYLRKLAIRRILWGVLPYAAYAVLIAAAGLISMFMFTALVISLGG